MTLLCIATRNRSVRNSIILLLWHLAVYYFLANPLFFLSKIFVYKRGRKFSKYKTILETRKKLDLGKLQSMWLSNAKSRFSPESLPSFKENGTQKQMWKSIYLRNGKEQKQHHEGNEWLKNEIMEPAVKSDARKPIVKVILICSFCLLVVNLANSGAGST